MKEENKSQKDGVTIITVENPQMGIVMARDILYREVDKQTLLLLSGGSQKSLYEMLAQEKRLKPFLVALVDERFGEKMHDNSNEKMIEETDFVAYLKAGGVGFYSILSGDSIEDTARNYEKTMRDLLGKSRKKIAILGIGPDGHTAGIAPNRSDFSNPLFSQKNNLVGWFDDVTGSFGKRVTTTFNALSKMNLLIILAFGPSKQSPLNAMFTEGSSEEIPSRFYARPDIAPKTLLITDQKV